MCIVMIVYQFLIFCRSNRMIYNFYAYPTIYQFQLFIQVIGTMTIHEGNGFTEVGLLVILLGD